MTNSTEVSGVHAVMVGVRSLDEAVPRFLKLLGGELREREYIEHSNFYRQLIRLPSGTHVQLMEPAEGEKPLSAFLERKGEGVFGIAFEASGLEGIEERLAAEDDIRVVGEIVDLPGMRELLVHPKDSFGVFTVYREIKEEV